MSAKLCSKSGCGAIARIGYPCTDWDCPQDVVSANEYRRALASSQEEIERLRKALEPFAKVLEHDIGEDEADADRFQPMRTPYNRAPLLTVGDFRAAARAIASKAGAA
jgi:hypothetical protein